MERMTETLRSLANQSSKLASRLKNHSFLMLLLLGVVVSTRLAMGQACLTPPSGMVSWWPGDGNANDIVGNNNGTLQGGATFASGEVGQAFSFNGTGAYVDVPNNNNLNPGTSDFTVDFWMNTSSVPNLAEYLLTKRDFCGFTSFWSIQTQTSGTVTAELGDTSGNYQAIFGTAVVNDGHWHHIALVRQSVTATLYIDGVMNRSGSTPGITNISNSSDVLFANSPCVPGNGSQPYQGLIDEVEYFNRALWPSEVQAIYSAGSIGKCKAPTLTNDLGAQIQALVVAGTLNQGQGNSLTTKLTRLLHSLGTGHTKTACNQAQAFINEVNDLIDTGVLTPAQGQPLIDLATSIRTALGC